MPTASEFENLTDKVAALIQADLNGFLAELGTGTVAPVATLLDNTGDQDLEGALMPYALVLDRQSLPENHATALAQILGRQGYTGLVQQWKAFVASVAGGAATLDAQLTAAGAVLHPLAAEWLRYPTNEADLSAANVFAPNYGVINPARVYQGADGFLADETTDAGDVGTADITLFGADDYCLYVGCNSKFSALIIALSTAANATITPTFQYWNGSSYVTLTVTDNSTGLTKNDTIQWTAPSDWKRCAEDGAGNAFADTCPRYYVRIQRTANSLSQAPVGTLIYCVPAAVTNASGAHLGVPQPPLALVRITGASALTVVSVCAPAYARFKAPAIRFRALTPGLGTPTLTVAYTDQDGNTGNTQAQSALSSPVAGDTVSITLAGGDTGVQAIETSGWSVSNGAQGVLAVEVVETRTPAL